MTQACAQGRRGQRCGGRDGDRQDWTQGLIVNVPLDLTPAPPGIVGLSTLRKQSPIACRDALGGGKMRRRTGSTIRNIGSRWIQNDRDDITLRLALPEMFNPILDCLQGNCLPIMGAWRPCHRFCREKVRQGRQEIPRTQFNGLPRKWVGPFSWARRIVGRRKRASLRKRNGGG